VLRLYRVPGFAETENTISRNDSHICCHAAFEFLIVRVIILFLMLVIMDGMSIMTTRDTAVVAWSACNAKVIGETHKKLPLLYFDVNRCIHVQIEPSFCNGCFFSRCSRLGSAVSAIDSKTRTICSVTVWI